MISDSGTDHGPREQSLFQTLVDSIHDYAIFALDAKGRIVSWNRGAQRIKGYTAEEVLGKHFSVFFTTEDRERGRPDWLLQQAAELGRVTDEGWRVRSDGSRFRASVVMTARLGPDGALQGFSKVTRDVTEARQVEDALRLRERQLSDAQELAGLGAWIWNVPEDQVSWTDELYHIYGLDRETFPATFGGYLDRVHPEDRERVRGIIEEVYRRGASFDFEERIVRPDGEVRVLRSRGRAERDEDGRVVRLTGACLDITEQKAAEAQSLQLAAEQAARRAAEAYAAGLGLLTRAGGVLASSLDYEQTLRTVADLAVPEMADWCAVDLLREDGTLQRVAVDHIDPAKIALAQRLADQYPAQHGLPQGFWHVVESGEPELYAEIADSMLAAAARTPEHLELLRAIGLRSAVLVPLAGRSGPVGVLTLAQTESGRRFNESDLQLVHELGRLAGLAIESAKLHRELSRQNEQLAEQALELGHQADELQTQANHLEEVMAELEQSQEDLQKRTSEAEEANRAKSDFLATMSHELRTPLNAIFGHADLIDLEIHGPVTDAQREALDRIKRNQRALLVLVNDVLNFAKLEAGKLEVTCRDVRVADIVAHVATVVGPQLEGKGLRFTTGPVPAQLTVWAERERVEQILLNLLTNAAKFTAESGEVSVAVDAAEDEVRFVVRDTGRGIAPERLEVIFDPFVQIGRQPEDTGDRGVGLGLAISRDLARAMGGSLAVESTPGVGSTFTLHLPRRPRA